MVAEMAQPAGHVYSALTRAAYILGMRKAKDRDRHTGRRMRASEISGQLMKAGFEWVPGRTMRHWAQKEADLPEGLIDDDPASVAGFPRWARKYLRGGSQQAEMRQTPLVPSSLIRSSVGLGLAVAAGVCVVAGVSRAVAGDRRRSQDPGPYRRRRPFRFARPENGARADTGNRARSSQPSPSRRRLHWRFARRTSPAPGVREPGRAWPRRR